MRSLGVFPAFLLPRPSPLDLAFPSSQIRLLVFPRAGAGWFMCPRRLLGVSGDMGGLSGY